jgi:hypothetical protein
VKKVPNKRYSVYIKTRIKKVPNNRYLVYMKTRIATGLENLPLLPRVIGMWLPHCKESR